jgi:hypothetical protein
VNKDYREEYYRLRLSPCIAKGCEKNSIVNIHSSYDPKYRHILCFKHFILKKIELLEDLFWEHYELINRR